MDKYKMADVAKKELKKTQEDLSRMKIESSGWRTEAKEKSGTITRQDKKISSLEKEIIELKDKLIDTQNEEVLNSSNDNEEQERLRQENCSLKTEIGNYKKELKKKEDSLKELKEEKKTCKKEEERIWKINNDNVDQISILRNEISQKEAKILVAEDLVHTANN